MSDHFEIVRTNAEPQPWHARLIQGSDITWHKENLTRKVGAERSILSMARLFGWTSPTLRANHEEDGGKVLVDLDNDASLEIPVVYLDERGAA